MTWRCFNCLTMCAHHPASPFCFPSQQHYLLSLQAVSFIMLPKKTHLVLTYFFQPTIVIRAGEAHVEEACC